MILDTCALLWLASEDKRLGAKARVRIADEALVHVSAISGFEIALKVRQGKLDLPASPQKWFETIIAHHDLRCTPLSMDLCIAAAQLPPLHNDPCDRFIIATAISKDWPIVTADKIFKRYGVEVISD